MIIDKLCQAAQYEVLHPMFKEAFEFLKTAAEKPDGRHELSGDMYVNMMSVRTHPAGAADLEAHRSYIDIQYIMGGHSACGWAQTDEAEVSVEYDAEKDCGFYRGERSLMPVSSGMFYILYPHDAHEPHVTDGEASSYRVAVVKVPVNG